MNIIRQIQLIICTLLCQQIFAQANKAPAYPLVTHDPYFSIWSMSDTLNASSTKHWTGHNQPLTGLIKVDGTAYRLIGNGNGETQEIAAQQKSVTMNATQTIYNF